MDPNANLKEQNDLLNAESLSDKRRRAELRRALADWLWSGGFKPDWSKYPDAAKAFRKWQRNMVKFQDLVR